MSGHSKWHSIKHKKGALDAKRGKIFTKHAKLIMIAARDGGDDPDMNPTLRSTIANAKSDNVPNANIEKSIKKGSGDDKNAANFVEVMYEGFGPAGTAIFVKSITDNKNRAVSSIKNAFTKNGGNMGEAGSIGWMFDKKGIIIVKIGDKDPEEVELEIIEAGAEDLEKNDDQFEVVTDASSVMRVRDYLEKAGFEIEKAEQTFLPKDLVKIDNAEDAKKILRLMEAIEDEEDVSDVYSNFDIEDDVMEGIM